MDVEADFLSSMSYALLCLKCSNLELKNKQLEALKAIYDGDDVFLWLPTGYGKSICNQAMTFLNDHKLKHMTLPSLRRSVCIIISPFISLMVDLVAQLRSLGVGCAILSGSSGVASLYLLL